MLLYLSCPRTVPASTSHMCCIIGLASVVKSFPILRLWRRILVAVAPPLRPPKKPNEVLFGLNNEKNSELLKSSGWPAKIMGRNASHTGDSLYPQKCWGVPFCSGQQSNLMVYFYRYENNQSTFFYIGAWSTRKNYYILNQMGTRHSPSVPRAYRSSVEGPTYTTHKF